LTGSVLELDWSTPYRKLKNCNFIYRVISKASRGLSFSWNQPLTSAVPSTLAQCSPLQSYNDSVPTSIIRYNSVPHFSHTLAQCSPLQSYNDSVPTSVIQWQCYHFSHKISQCSHFSHTLAQCSPLHSYNGSVHISVIRYHSVPHFSHTLAKCSPLQSQYSHYITKISRIPLPLHFLLSIPLSNSTNRPPAPPYAPTNSKMTLFQTVSSKTAQRTNTCKCLKRFYVRYQNWPRSVCWRIVHCDGHRAVHNFLQLCALWRSHSYANCWPTLKVAQHFQSNFEEPVVLFNLKNRFFTRH
jgi:hypothetical protein